MKDYLTEEELRYLTDEELDFLIEKVENTEPYAPGYLKEQILHQAAVQTGSFLAESKSASAVGGLAYRTKIIAGMAAAVVLAVSFSVCGSRTRLMWRQWEEDVRLAQLQKWEESANERMLFEWNGQEEHFSIWEEEESDSEKGWGFDTLIQQRSKRIDWQLEKLFQQINSLLS